MYGQISGTSTWKRAGYGLRALGIVILLATPAGAAEVLPDRKPVVQG